MTREEFDKILNKYACLHDNSCEAIWEIVKKLDDEWARRLKEQVAVVRKIFQV